MKHFSNPDPEVQGKEGVESLVGLALGNGGGQIGRLEIGMNKLGEIIRIIQCIQYNIIHRLKTVFLIFQVFRIGSFCNHFIWKGGLQGIQRILIIDLKDHKLISIVLNVSPYAR